MKNFYLVFIYLLLFSGCKTTNRHSSEPSKVNVEQLPAANEQLSLTDQEAATSIQGIWISPCLAEVSDSSASSKLALEFSNANLSLHTLQFVDENCAESLGEITSDQFVTQFVGASALRNEKTVIMKWYQSLLAYQDKERVSRANRENRFGSSTWMIGMPKDISAFSAANNKDLIFARSTVQSIIFRIFPHTDGSKYLFVADGDNETGNNSKFLTNIFFVQAPPAWAEDKYSK